jgi:hypothetical protein
LHIIYYRDLPLAAMLLKERWPHPPAITHINAKLLSVLFGQAHFASRTGVAILFLANPELFYTF